MLLATPKNQSTLGPHRANDTSIESASSVETAASQTSRLATVSLPSVNILMSTTLNVQRPTQMMTNESNMNQSAMYKTQMPQNAFGYMQHGNNPQRPPSYKQMRPQGVMIPPPMPIQSVQNMMDPSSNPPSGQMLSPIPIQAVIVQNMMDPSLNPPSAQMNSPHSPFEFPSPDFLSPLDYLSNSYF